MLQQEHYIQSTDEEISHIESVKGSIEELRESGNFFSVSLQTLELIRRFNHLYIQVFEKMDQNPSLLHQLVVAASGLEEKLIRES
ncbi:hypothetical protein [uncultured Christiangramia sp.]|uniref:hypothetical protein n=1 Tax=uncultured Christiangramia sp. TaxID=503836 RepID=UPI0025E9B76B|nr:hypothetical protein [uncultured Christiangramia sp.]|tara:strand:- start:53 stop:307 length:255 start_codon:yes stop_codon:yes gene_type:complete